MSSILTALKKIEEDSTAAQGLQALKDQKRLKGIIRLQHENRKRKKRILAAAVAGFVVLFAAGAAGTRFAGIRSFPDLLKTFSSTHESVPIPQQEKSMVVVQNADEGYHRPGPKNDIRTQTPPPKAATNTAVEPPRAKSAELQIRLGETGGPKPAAAPLIPIEGFDRPLARAGKTGQPGLTPPAVAEPADAVITAEADDTTKGITETEQPAADAPTVQATEKHDQPAEPPLDAETVRQFSPGAAPALKLQAIAYADDPKKRMAVIDGQIVHEGTPIGKYKLNKINREDIEITDGKSNWRIAFKAR